MREGRRGVEGGMGGGGGGGREGRTKGGEGGEVRERGEGRKTVRFSTGSTPADWTTNLQNVM